MLDGAVETVAGFVPSSVPRGIAKGGVYALGGLLVFGLIQKVIACFPVSISQANVAHLPLRALVFFFSFTRAQGHSDIPYKGLCKKRHGAMERKARDSADASLKPAKMAGAPRPKETQTGSSRFQKDMQG
eukprot:scaffold195917_cov23-Tisochrysis_lutea.AAC.1